MLTMSAVDGDAAAVASIARTESLRLQPAPPSSAGNGALTTAASYIARTLASGDASEPERSASPIDRSTFSRSILVIRFGARSGAERVAYRLSFRSSRASEERRRVDRRALADRPRVAYAERR